MEEEKGEEGKGRRTENRRGKGREQRAAEDRKAYKVGFWNVAGMVYKDRDFWENLKDWDVMVLSETWVQEKGWEKVRRRLPRGYRWEMQEAGRKNRKGRAIGGMVMGVRGGIESDMGGRVEKIWD